MVSVPWCHDCNNPLGLCSCDDSPEQDFRDYHHGVVAELQKTIAAKDAAIERLVAENRALTEALTPFAAERLPSSKATEIAYNEFGLRCLMSPLAIARQRARQALKDAP